MKKHAERAHKSIHGISTASLRLLLDYDWPGNVRELENAIERAVLLETADVLQAHNLPAQFLPVHDATDESPPPGLALQLAEVERKVLLQTLDAVGNNLTLAARSLGINRVTLHRKLKKHDISLKG